MQAIIMFGILHNYRQSDWCLVIIMNKYLCSVVAAKANTVEGRRCNGLGRVRKLEAGQRPCRAAADNIRPALLSYGLFGLLFWHFKRHRLHL